MGRGSGTGQNIGGRKKTVIDASIPAEFRL
jgi:hypothetical protein